MDDNLPPTPIYTPHITQMAYRAYVWNGYWMEIGHAETEQFGHTLFCFIGVRVGDVIELRSTHPDFNPGWPNKKGKPEPSYRAFNLKNERIGTAWPHEDRRGHRLKIRADIEDGKSVWLQPSGAYKAASGGRALIRRATIEFNK